MSGPWEDFQDYEEEGPWSDYGGGDPSQRPQPETVAQVTPGESFQAGVAQGGTLGIGEELMGGLRATQDIMGDKYSISDLPERYRQRRGEYRAYNELARGQNPGSYMGGEITGGVLTAFIPGGQVGTLGKAALMGGASGLGLSEADLTEGDFSGAAGDIAKGAALGAGTYGVMKGAGKILSKARPKQLAKSYLGLPEPAYERLVKDPEAVKAALSKADDFYGLPDISKRLSSRVDDLAEEAVSGSQAARRTLEFEGTQTAKDKLYSILQGKLDEIKASEGRIPNDAYNEAKNTIIRQMEKIKGVDELSGPELMDRVREMRQVLNFNPSRGNIDTKSAAAIKDIAHQYDQVLKASSPAYTQVMADTADAARLLEKARPLARSEQGAMNFVGSVDRAGNKFKADILRELDRRFGDTLSEDAMNAIAARVIDRSAAAGSQRVNLGAKIGEAIGSLFPGEKFGKVMGAAGAAAGAGVDAYGRRIAIPFIEKSAAIERALQSNAFSRGISDILQKAAQKGPQNLVLTFQLLSRSNPELESALQP